MSPVDIAAILITAAATAGYLNHRFLRLPATSGTLVVALASSLLLVASDYVIPGRSFQGAVAAFMGAIYFNAALMRGMLSFLLFAGALHVDLDGLLENKWTIGALATIGVVLSTAVVGMTIWWVFKAIGFGISLPICLTFGALISPTDPIAVMGLLKEMRAPRSLEALVAGESLFNDGVGVVVFFGVVAVAGVAQPADESVPALIAMMGTFFLREVAGGVALGLGLGYLGYRALKSLDDHPLELLITLAIAMFIYSASFWIHVSGPIAVVIAGLLIGNPGRRFAMSARTREHVDGFWRMVDEILNAILFLLLGLEVLAVSTTWATVAAGALTIPVVLLARLVAVALPIAALSARRSFVPGVIPVLTWSGLRGGLSVAMALSLPPIPGRDLLLTSTYAVVVFSIVVQGLTTRRLLRYYRIGEESL